MQSRFAKLKRLSVLQNMQHKVLLRFVTVGVLTAALYALVLIVSVEVLGIPPPVGAAVAHLAAIAFNYLAHHRWTYQAGQPHRAAAPRYLVTIIVLFCLNVAATAVLPGLLGVSYAVVQGLLMVLTALATFVTLSRWVFAMRALT